MSRQASMITINSQRYKEKQNKSICIFNYVTYAKVHKMLNKKMLPKKKKKKKKWGLVCVDQTYIPRFKSEAQNEPKSRSFHVEKQMKFFSFATASSEMGLHNAILWLFYLATATWKTKLIFCLTNSLTVFIHAAEKVKAKDLNKLLAHVWNCTTFSKLVIGHRVLFCFV